MRAWVIVVIVMTLLPGCTFLPGKGDDPADPTRTPVTTSPVPAGPPLRFAGTLRDARSGDAVLDATVRLDLAQTLPCGRQGLGWTSWDASVANGTWGPLEVPRPKSNDVAFFLHARAPGYTENATFVGPTQAKAGTANMTVLLHRDASVEGTAPPGTVLALDAPTFPRLIVAGANGTFRFAQARTSEASFVAATDDPYRSVVRAPTHLDIPATGNRGWLLEGVVKGPSGAPLAADIVAWNGSALVSAARAGDNGVFTLPLAPTPIALRIEARTSDNQFGAVRAVEIQGPPALRETLLAKALC